MKRALRWLFGLLVLGVLVLAGADYLVWRWAGGLIAENYANWRAAREAEGWVVENGPPHLGGWPFEARLSVPDVALKGGAGVMPGGMALTLPVVDLAVSVMAPRDLRITAEGTARARLAFLPPLAITAEAAELHAILAAEPEAAAPLAGSAARVTVQPDEAAQGAAQGLIFTIDRIDFLLSSPAAPPTLTVHAQANGIGLPAAIAWPFGPHIGRLSFDLSLAPPLPPGTDFAANEAAWHQAGGALRLAATLTDWGGAALSGEAKIGLDDKLAPEGTGLLHLIDPDAAVASLAHAGMIPDGSAQALGAVLRLIARPAAEGGKPEVDLPLAWSAGTVSAGGIPLFRLTREGLGAP